jgi:hypothetical protein
MAMSGIFNFYAGPSRSSFFKALSLDSPRLTTPNPYYGLSYKYNIINTYIIYS